MSEQDKLIKSMKKELDPNTGSSKSYNDKDIVKDYVQKMEVYRRYREQFDDDLDDNFRLYTNKYNKKLQTTPTTSELQLPVAFTTVENWLTKVAGAFFSGDRVWEVVPSRHKDASKTTKPTQKLLDYQMDIYNWEYEVYDILKTVGIYGLAWVFFGWEFKIGEEEIDETVPVMDKDGNMRFNELGEPQMTVKKSKRSYIDQDRPSMMNVPFKEVYWDPKARSVEESKCIFREYFQDVDEIKRKQKNGTFNKKFSIDDLSDFSSKEIEKTSQEELVGYQASDVDRQRKRIMVWDIYEDTKWVTILNKTVLAKEIQNPLRRKRKPIVLVRGIPLPHSLHPLGEIEIVKPLNIEKNTIRNMRIDQVSLDINQMYAYDKNADIDEKDLISRPNGFVGVRPINGSVENAIIPLRKAYVQAPAYQEEALLKEDLQDATGAHDYAVGKTPERREAARTVGRLQDAAVSRFDITKVRVLMFQMKDIPKMIMLMNHTYLSDDSIDVRVYDKAAGEYTWENLSLDDIDFDCDFRFPGSLGKAMKQQRKQELFQFVMEAGQMQNAYLAMGGKPFIDLSVPMKQYLIEGEWGDLAREAIIGPMDRNTPVSPQTMQKENADRRKQENEGQGKEQEMAMKAKMAEMEMGLKGAKGKQEMQQKGEKHALDMAARKAKAEQDMEIAKKKAEYGPEE